jgi:hypothetical protein
MQACRFLAKTAMAAKALILAIASQRQMASSKPELTISHN